MTSMPKQKKTVATRHRFKRCFSFAEASSGR
jgi:hypothetical protein